MKKNPEKLSARIRRTWLIASILCAVGALVYIALVGDPQKTIAISAAGVAFWFMSRWRHDDFDF